jgi:hypothetical protein
MATYINPQGNTVTETLADSLDKTPAQDYAAKELHLMASDGKTWVRVQVSAEGVVTGTPMSADDARDKGLQ